MRKRHVFFVFVTCVSNHKTLVTSSKFFNSVIFACLKTLKDFGTLDIESHNNAAVPKLKFLLIVHTFFDIVITNCFNCLSYYLLVGYLSFSVDFSENHAHVVFDTCFTCDFRFRINSENCI